MAIHFFSDVRQRNRIGLVEEEPTLEAAEILHGYQLYRCDSASLAQPGMVATTAAAVFRQSSSNPRRISKHLRDYAPSLLAGGCFVFVQCLSGTDGARFRKLVIDAIDEAHLPPSGLTPEESERLGDWHSRKNRPLTPVVHVLQNPDDWHGVMRYLQLHSVAHSPVPGASVQVRDAEGNEEQLDLERIGLVQRAFWDASEVRLEKLRNGLSGVDAYRAYVRSTGSVVGEAWPYRYFVKLGPRSKVATEYLAYRDIALEHLPYHLGPRLRLERCALGHRSGIIVSDYVNGAEPLRDCARDGRAAGVIANLFNVTYKAWHNGTREENKSIEEHLMSRVPESVPEFRKALIEGLGAQKTLLELADLITKGDSRPVSIGVIHGDLHATNVLVRGGDSILIDFEKVQSEGLVLRDLACLEGGLFVDGFVNDRRMPSDIIQSVASLYERDVLLKGRVTACHPADGSSWFFDCVSQIRMYARQFELADGQYSLVLASELLRKACNKENFDALKQASGAPRPSHGSTARVSMEQTRAMAYVLAERILRQLRELV